MTEDNRRRASSGSPFETTIGFSRAIRVGDRILVSGTAPVEDDGTSTPGDAGAQAERCFVLIERAIAALGGTMADVVRTRMFLTDAEDAVAVGDVHGRWMQDGRPAATMAVVAALLRPEWRIEIEAEAMLDATA
ncbi:RidA family protein [Sphingomonas sp. MMS24-J13]|uniref:RidA family protein n=1 Tax=Sphingomonas sp. MMS24-J13 TaxID=3238686 RepID=UPI00384C98F2